MNTIIKFWKLHKLTCCAFACVTLFCINTAHAQTTRTTLGPKSTVNNIDKSGQFGVGVQAGSFSGVNLDYWYSHNDAWTAALAGQYGNTAVTLAHHWYLTGTFSGEANILVPYIGAGALVVFGNRSDDFPNRSQSTAVAAQMPIGLELLPSAQRFSVFAELRPSLEVSPDLFAFFNADIGGRFYF